MGPNKIDIENTSKHQLTTEYLSGSYKNINWANTWAI